MNDADDKWSRIDRMGLDEFEELKQSAGRRIRWARYAFSPKQSMNAVGSDPRFKKIFSKTKGYSVYKFKDVEKGEFGKGQKGFRDFILGISEFYNVPIQIFIDPDLGRIRFQKMIREGWAAITEEPGGIGEAKKNPPEFIADMGGAPEISSFFGRGEQLDRLTRWIERDNCRLVAVAGMGGIGKTRLAVKVATHFADPSLRPRRFDAVIWRSMMNAPSLIEILRDWVRILSGDEDIALPDDVHGQKALLLDCFQSMNCLLVLDNAESILRSGETAGKYADGYENYGELFRLIGETGHRSCLLITSRERTREIDQMAVASPHVKILELEGLPNAAVRRIFENAGLRVSGDAACRRITDVYKGNPLALELVAKHVAEVYFKDLSAFVESGNPIFDDMTDLLDQQFQRFSFEEQQVLHWLALNREPISIHELKEDLLSPVIRNNSPSVLQSIQRRLPLEKKDGRFSLQPVFIEFLTEKFVAAICREIETGRLSLFNTHAIVKASAKNYIRKAQLRLIADAIIQRIGASSGMPFAKRLHQLIAEIRNSPRLKEGYAGGNIINLLCRTDVDLTGFDFSRIPVWQAHLQGRRLYDVDFSHADMRNTVFTSPMGSIIAIAVSDDGKYLAVADANCAISIRNANDDTLIHTLTGHASWVRSIAFSPDSKLLASCGDDQTVQIWALDTGECVKTLKGHANRVQSVAFSGDGEWIASASFDCSVKVWSVGRGDCAATLPHAEAVYAVAFAPGDLALATACEDHSIAMWELKKRQCVKTYTGHSDRVRSIAFSPDGKSLASGGDDRRVMLWDTETRTCIGTMAGHADRIRSVAFSPAGDTLASGGEDRKVRIWDTGALKCTKVLQGHTNRIRCVVFAPDGKTLFSGGDDQSLRRWDVAEGKSLSTLSGYTNFIRSIRFRESGDSIISCSQDGRVNEWDLETGRVVCSLTTPDHWPLRSVCSGNIDIGITTGQDLSIRVWDIRTGQCLKILKGHASWVRDVIVTDDGERLISCSDDRTIKIWLLRTGECIRTLGGHTDRVCTIAIGGDMTLASGSYDKTIRLWNTESGRLEATLEGHAGRICSVAFNPDHSKIVSASGDRTVRIWALDTARCDHVLKGHTDWIRTALFSTDGQRIASGGEDNMIRIWDASDGRRLGALEGHESWIMGLAFHPDDGSLASCSNDETIRFWRLATGECFRVLKQPKPYQGMNISNTTGLTAAQKTPLISLGAVDETRSNHPARMF